MFSIESKFRHVPIVSDSLKPIQSLIYLSPSGSNTLPFGGVVGAQRHCTPALAPREAGTTGTSVTHSLGGVARAIFASKIPTGHGRVSGRYIMVVYATTTVKVAGRL